MQKHIIEPWLRLSRRNRAILWTLISGLLFSAMSALVKFTGQNLPPMQVVFGRSLFGLLLILPFIVYFKPQKVFELSRWKLQVVRTIIGVSAMSCTFYALIHLPLVDVTAINFSKPIFILLLAALFLREKVTMVQWILTLIGFLGILLILRPNTESFNGFYLVAILAAILVAFAITIVKELTESETPFSILAWFSLLSTIFTLPFALYVWQMPTIEQWMELALTGFFGIVAQFCVIRGYALAPASYLAPLGYLNIFYTGILGAVIFQHTPDFNTVVGAFIIVLSTYYLMRRKKGKTTGIEQGSVS